MVKSMNAAIAGLKAHQTRLDVIGNNIANVNTWGYKTRTTNFKDSVYTNLINGQSGNAVLGNLGGINVSQLGYGSVVSSVSANFGTSNGQYTGNDLDCMIDGTGFFIVGPYRDAVDNIQEVEGENTEGQFNIANSGMLLSRVGIFTPDANGYLVDDSGNYVFGYIPDNQTPNENNVVPMNYDNLVPIRIPVNEETGEMYSISSWRIGQSGTIIGTATNGDIVTIGQIAVASVENPNGLNQKTGYYYEVGNNPKTSYHHLYQIILFFQKIGRDPSRNELD